MGSVTPNPPDFGSTALSGALTIGNTVAQGIFAQQAAKSAGKQVHNNSGLILALAGGGGLFLLILVLVLVFAFKRK